MDPRHGPQFCNRPLHIITGLRGPRLAFIVGLDFEIIDDPAGETADGQRAAIDYGSHQDAKAAHRWAVEALRMLERVVRT